LNNGRIAQEKSTSTCYLKWSCRTTVIKLKGGDDASSSFCFQGSPLPWMYHDTFGDNGVYKSVYGENSENLCLLENSICYLIFKDFGMNKGYTIIPVCSS